MRITNKVMQNNALVNINRNKELQDSLNTELATGKKINRPSEDPVVAIRALRLRSDVSQVSQYYKKNVPDAESWLELTESSIKTTLSVVKDMINQCEKGSNDTLTTSDRKIVIDALKELKNEVYATGDADYAGRYIFTGYRTDTSLTFGENTERETKIKEIISSQDMDEYTYVGVENGGTKLTELSESRFNGASLMKEQDITSSTCHRIKLAYGNVDDDPVPTVSFSDVNGDPIAGLPDVTPTKVDNREEAYETMKSMNEAGTEDMIFIPSTGEILISDALYDKINTSGADMTVDYNKKNWLASDLKPEHYFYTEAPDDKGNTVIYNTDYVKNKRVGQDIEYQVGFNQSIVINTNAEDIFKHSLGRDIDEIIDLANYLTDIENMRDKFKAMSEDTSRYTDDEIEDINSDLDAATKASELAKDQLQKTFSKYITKMQNYLNITNEAVTTVGSRAARLELISNRLDDQTTTFKTLQSENEDADATEIAVQLSSAQVSYDAALMSTSEMIQKTLLNYL